MTHQLTKEKLLTFLAQLGQSARTPGVCFITGGASALLEGWRDTTIDVDIRLDPEPEGVFDAIPRLKRELSINVELASPSDFIPALPDWRERSRFIGEFGRLRVYHYDFVSQALAKLERGHAKDLLDVEHLVKRKLVKPGQLLACLEAIQPQMNRYPAIDPASFSRRVRDFANQHNDV